MKKKNLFLMLLISIMLLTVACGPGKKKSDKGTEKVDISKFPTAVENNEKSVEGGTLKVAMVKDSAMVGLFSSVLATDGFDMMINSSFIGEQIFDTDENFEVMDTGAASLEVDVANKKATIKIKDNAKWNDGQPLIADDVIYAIQV